MNRRTALVAAVPAAFALAMVGASTGPANASPADKAPAVASVTGTWLAHTFTVTDTAPSVTYTFPLPVGTRVVSAWSENVQRTAGQGIAALGCPNFREMSQPLSAKLVPLSGAGCVLTIANQAALDGDASAPYDPPPGTTSITVHVLAVSTAPETVAP